MAVEGYAAVGPPDTPPLYRLVAGYRAEIIDPSVETGGREPGCHFCGSPDRYGRSHALASFPDRPIVPTCKYCLALLAPLRTPEQTAPVAVAESWLCDHHAEWLTREEWWAPESWDDDWYQGYLTTLAWRRRRARVLDEWDGKCGWCGRGRDMQVHHVTYDRLGHERAEDLIPLCAECHREAHQPDFDAREEDAPRLCKAWAQEVARRARREVGARRTGVVAARVGRDVLDSDGSHGTTSAAGLAGSRPAGATRGDRRGLAVGSSGAGQKAGKAVGVQEEFTFLTSAEVA